MILMVTVMMVINTKYSWELDQMIFQPLITMRFVTMLDMSQNMFWVITKLFKVNSLIL